jgi:murein DD-endopeptidase MepM/ murein hydrolase activator NlpD
VLRVTSPFGVRANPLDPDEGKKSHLGVDYGADEGDLLRAIGDGVIESVGESTRGGRQIVLVDDTGDRWSMLHLLDIAVSRGQRVNAGDVIGLTGDTGMVTGPHLHIQLMRKGAVIDPDPVLRALPAFARSSSTTKKRSGFPWWIVVVGAGVYVATRTKKKGG